ncbi:hypothetical protein DH2020_003453 [Rehmannia glutinosa]|uniref:Uncharacterized protein n=1 Tax=Rehmannia glutinosa TaxID=99300 RepID=A0ABR0XLN7_REHGL
MFAGTPLLRVTRLLASLTLEFGLNLRVSMTKVLALLPRNGKELAKVERTSLATRARYYNSKAPKDVSARDLEGHGSHCASIAAGNYVKGASLYGIAEGTARGGVPSARIAAYKVCSFYGCDAADILAAFDDAIADGVDIITISIGGDNPVKLENDAIAIGSLHSLEKGILVVQSAGNSADKETVSSVAPWIFSVAASSTDRGIVAKVALGNGTILSGKSVNAFSLNGTSFPLVYGKDVSRKCNESDAMNCAENCLENSLVKGKIVLCRLIEGVDEAFSAGALGSVTALESVIPGLPLSDVSYVIPIAASSLQTKDFPLVESYFRSTKSPKVDIMKSESVKILMPLGLLPDITAPGIEILAAYSPEAAPSDNYNDLRMVNYNILSEHQCLVHMLRSRCLSWIMDSRKDPLAEFAYGAGQIDPVKAVDPGLVYETFTEDYIKLLCSLGYDSTKLKQIFGVNTTCPAGPQTTPKDLNYPSMTSQIKTSGGNKNVTFSEKFARTVTNVGPGKSTYKVTTSTSPEYNITVTPNVLTFGATNEKKSFDVIISGKITNGKMVSASLEWSDGVHKVRSPIVVYPDNF